MKHGQVGIAAGTRRILPARGDGLVQYLDRLGGPGLALLRLGQGDVQCQGTGGVVEVRGIPARSSAHSRAAWAASTG